MDLHSNLGDALTGEPKHYRSRLLLLATLSCVPATVKARSQSVGPRIIVDLVKLGVRKVVVGVLSIGAEGGLSLDHAGQ